ncbi:Major Facilitator Superfamily protein [Loktanella fryxellensis]|uniref:Major Facilitator Superfamily protein n=1 Tax=Loktanella fryxellensis TaxID=245187 RepID=A0A1H8GX02_9RHOB|nr:MFS transporter [Loktanella fryxellensis]SEN48319.1 Major Facilitator Superfamily protein [Loktanella fryxellensis]
MGGWIALLRGHAILRTSALAIFLYGFAGAATSPYQAVIGIRELGLSDAAYAAISLIAAVANVAIAVASGFLSDRHQRYRAPLTFVAAFGLLGYGAVWLHPTQLTFAFAMVGPLALFHATNSMLFGNLRSRTTDFTAPQTAIATALMRMMISLSWVLVPGIVGVLLLGRDSLIGAYGIAALFATLCLATILTLPRDANPLPRTGPRPGALSDLWGVLSRGMAARIMGVALITQVLTVNATVLPLIVTGRAGGTAADIGILVGMVALIEVVFMVLWAMAITRIRITMALFINAALYFAYLAALAVATAPWHVYVASVVGGIGAAGIISLPISYLLDLIRDRPGLSASLIAVNMFLGAALGSAVFALGTHVAGYGTASVLGGVAGIAGAALLVMLERDRT